jgi:hypothetical protein
MQGPRQVPSLPWGSTVTALIDPKRSARACAQHSALRGSDGACGCAAHTLAPADARSCSHASGLSSRAWQTTVSGDALIRRSRACISSGCVVASSFVHCTHIRSLDPGLVREIMTKTPCRPPPRPGASGGARDGQRAVTKLRALQYRTRYSRVSMPSERTVKIRVRRRAPGRVTSLSRLWPRRPPLAP